MEKIREQYRAVNRRIFNLRDGEIQEMQIEYGAVYKKSLGVPIISLQTLAKEYKPSHELAKLLWEFGGREQLLVAAMLDEPEQLTANYLETVLGQTHTPELWEQITKSLLRRLSEREEIIRKWIASEQENLQIYALLLWGYTPDFFEQESIQKVLDLPMKKGSYLQKCAYRVLLKLGLRKEEHFQLMMKILPETTDWETLRVELRSFYA